MRFLCALAVYVLMSLACGPVLAAERLTLLDTLPEPDTSSNPANFKRVGNLLFFNANGSEIWVTDGTEAGTRKTTFTGTIDDTYYASDTALYRYKVSSAYAMPSLVEYKDGPEGPLQAMLIEIQCDGVTAPDSFLPDAIIEYKGEIYFRANAKLDDSQPDYGRELIAVERGTPNVFRIVEDIRPGSDSSTPRFFRQCDDLFFFGATVIGGGKVHYTDGNSVSMIDSEYPLASPLIAGDASIMNAGDTLYFFTRYAQALSGSSYYFLNKRLPVTGNISIPGSIGPLLNPPTSLTPNGNGLFFVTGNNIWRTTADGLGIEKLTNEAFHTPERLTVAGGNLYFTALSVSNNNKELWRINAAGEAALVKEISPGTASTEFFGMAEMNGTLYFQCKDLTGKIALWKSDGTTDGTVIIQSFDNETPPIAMATMNGHLFFPADDYKHAVEPHISDGTFGDTEMLANLCTVPVDPPIGQRIWSSGQTLSQVFFHERLDRVQLEDISLLYAMNEVPGTSKLIYSSTTPLGAASSVRLPLNSLFNGNAVFYAQEVNARLLLTTREYLLSSDGTKSETAMLLGNGPWWYSDWGGPKLDIVGEYAYVQAGNETIRTDGTKDATVNLAGLIPGNQEYVPILGIVGSNSFLRGYENSTGYELWRTNGTPAGTKLVKDIYPGSASSNPYEGRMAGSIVYFGATTPEAGTELWRTNGAESGTKLVEDIVPGTGSSNPSCLGATDADVMIFSANGNEIWRSNGNAAGTYLLKDTWEGTADRGFEYVGTHLGKVYVSARSPNELWVSDGTEAGTKKVAETSTGSSHYRYLGVLGERLFVSNPSNQKCAVDGSELTVISTNTSQGVFSDKYFYQCIGQSEHGTTFLRSDGTAEGTQQFTAPSTGSSPVLLGILDGQLIYSVATTEPNAQKIWSFDLREDAGAELGWRRYE